MPVIPYIPDNPCGITIVGEAPGEEEERIGFPFMGASGKELTSMLKDAGIDRYTCHLTNVFHERPPENKLDHWCTGALEAKKLNGGVYPWNPLARGKYIRAEILAPALDRLRHELISFKPKLVIVLGNTPLYALTGSGGISNVRGVVQPCSLLPGVKLLPTYHPAYILRKYEDRAIVIVDFMKAKRELAFPEIRRPEREVWIEPTLEDLSQWEDPVLAATKLAVDIETKRQQITCIGFSPTRQTSFVVPFVDRRKPDYSYWPSASAELQALAFVRRWLQSPVPKVFQNGLYDIQWIWKKWGIAPVNCIEDTMLRHHAIQPELNKSLGFMGSLYTDEASWKLMRTEAHDTIKRDE